MSRALHAYTDITCTDHRYYKYVQTRAQLTYPDCFLLLEDLRVEKKFLACILNLVKYPLHDTSHSVTTWMLYQQR